MENGFKKTELNPNLIDKKCDIILAQFEGLDMRQVKVILNHVDMLLERKFILVTPLLQNQELNP